MKKRRFQQLGTPYKMIEKIDSEKKYVFIYIILLLGILLFRLGKITQPYFTDEVGYWSFAAWLNGIDWSGVMSRIGYYGYGYGVLLAPLFCFDNSTYMYCAAVVLNAVMVLGLFGVHNLILKELFPKLDYKTRLFAAFVPCCYTYVIVYANLTMCEICLTLLSAIYLYLMLLVSKKITWLRVALLSLVIGALIAVHLKSLIFVIITGIYWLFRLVRDKEERKKLLSAIVMVVFFVAVAFLIKDVVVRVLYTDRVTLTHETYNDDISQKIGLVSDYLNFKFIINYSMCFIAKLFYLSVSSLGLFDFALVYLFKRVYCSYKEKNAEEFERTFILTLVLGVWILYAAFISGKSDIDRVDNLLYGRYIESIMPVFLSLGVIEFESSRRRKQILLKSMALCLVGAFLCYGYLLYCGLDGQFPSMLPMQISGVVGYPGIKNMDKALAVTVYVALLFYAVGLIMEKLAKKKVRWAIVLCAVVWILTAYNGMKQYVYNTYETTDISKDSKLTQFESIQNVAEQLRKTKDEKIYYVYNDSDSSNASYFQMYDLQYDLIDRILTVVSYDEFLNLPSNSLVVVNLYQKDYSKVKSMLVRGEKIGYFYIGRTEN